MYSLILDIGEHKSHDNELILQSEPESRNDYTDYSQDFSQEKKLRFSNEVLVSYFTDNTKMKPQHTKPKHTSNPNSNQKHAKFRSDSTSVKFIENETQHASINLEHFTSNACENVLNSNGQLNEPIRLASSVQNESGISLINEPTHKMGRDELLLQADDLRDSNKNSDLEKTTTHTENRNKIHENLNVNKSPQITSANSEQHQRTSSSLQNNATIIQNYNNPVKKQDLVTSSLNDNNVISKQGRYSNLTNPTMQTPAVISNQKYDLLKLITDGMDSLNENKKMHYQLNDKYNSYNTTLVESLDR